MFNALTQSIALLTSLFFFIVGNGFLMTFFTVRLNALGANTWIVGAVSAAFYLGFVSGAFKLGALITRIGHIRAFAVCAAIFTIVTLVQGLFVEPYLWIALRLIAGFTTAGIYIVIESWLLASSDITERGKLLGIYMIVLYGGQALGQFILNFIHLDGLLPFIIMAILTSLSIVPLSLTHARMPLIETPSVLTIHKLYRFSPSGVTGSISAGIITGAAYGLVPLYITQIFDSPSYVSFFMASLIIGGMSLQYPIGRFSDMVDRRTVLILISTLTLASSAAIVILQQHDFYVTLALFFIFGGLAFALYPLALSHVCDHVESSDIIATDQGMLLLYSLGAAIGPMIAPAFIQYFGPEGMFIFCGCMGAILATYFLWRRFQRPGPRARDQQPYVSIPRTSPVISEFDPRAEEDEEAESEQKDKVAK